MKKYEKLKRHEIKPVEEYGGSTLEEKEENKKYFENKNKEIDFQNERFNKEGIPPYSIKLEIGKNYEGDADGDWEILTINNELWFCSNWSCLNFYEIKND